MIECCILHRQFARYLFVHRLKEKFLRRNYNVKHKFKNNVAKSEIHFQMSMKRGIKCH